MYYLIYNLLFPLKRRERLNKVGIYLIVLTILQRLILFYISLQGKDTKAEAVLPSPVALVPEEKVSFSLYALSVSSLTVAKIRKVYNKLDSKAIAKQVSLS